MTDDGPAPRTGSDTRVAGDPAIDTTTLDLVPEAVVVLDRAGRLLYANRTAARLLDAGAADRESPFARFVAPESAGDWSAIVEAFRSPETMPQVVPLNLANVGGDLVPVELALGAAGHHVMAVVRDVTAQRTHEALTQRMLSDMDEHRARVEMQAEQFITQAEDLHVSERRLALIGEWSRTP